jgi:hypothetical protein
MGQVGTIILKLTPEDAEELRRGLRWAQSEVIRALGDQAGCGYSSTGIDLCQRKWRLQHLLECLHQAPRLQLVPQPVCLKSDLAAAA